VSLARPVGKSTPLCVVSLTLELIKRGLLGMS
jgi:hypothetical protein